MNTCSYFIKDKALFGSYPNQEQVHELEEIGVRYFIDLTDPVSEFYKVTKYETKYTYISYPIKDHSIPTNLRSFAQLILQIADILKKLEKDKKIFINCIGGHGRSGIVVASVLCFVFQISPQNALEYTKYFHNNRENMREKWRKIGSPQTLEQKKFVIDFFKPYLFYKDEVCFLNNYDFFDEDSFKNLDDCNQGYQGYQGYQGRSNVELYAYIFTIKILKNKDNIDNFLQTLLRPIEYPEKEIFGKILSIIKYKLLENNFYN